MQRAYKNAIDKLKMLMRKYYKKRCSMNKYECSSAFLEDTSVWYVVYLECELYKCFVSTYWIMYITRRVTECYWNFLLNGLGVMYIRSTVFFLRTALLTMYESYLFMLIEKKILFSNVGFETKSARMYTDSKLFKHYRCSAVQYKSK